MTRGLTKQQELEIENRRKIVAANLLAGLNYRDMAAQLNVSIGTIASDVKKITTRLKHEQLQDIELVAQTELRRLDAALNAIWTKVTAGDFSAIDKLLRLQDQRAKYLPLFGPDRMELSGPGGKPIEIEDINKIRDARWEAVQQQLAEALKQNQSEDGS
jgi:hypothetical protein